MVVGPSAPPIIPIEQASDRLNPARSAHQNARYIPICAAAPKSNAVYTAYARAQEEIKKSGTLPVPLHIRNAPTSLMKELGDGKGYQYAHQYREAIVSQEFLPDKINEKRFYFPSDRGFEKVIKERMDYREKKKRELRSKKSKKE